MNERPKSKGEVVIEKIMEELDPSSPRYQILATARQFKSSWVELGAKLQEVQRQGLFQQWGYDSFDAYCSREIRIKAPTAQKLTLAYRYLEKEEPELFARQTEIKPLPDYRSVDLLRQAREDQGFSDAEYAELRKAVVEEERSHPTVRKRFKEMAASNSPEEADPGRWLRSALTAGQRLATCLEELPALQARHRQQLEQLLADLNAELLQRGPDAPAGENPPW